MRSEFIGECALFHGLLDTINKGIFIIPHLNRKELRLAIEAPAKIFQGEVDTNLTNILLMNFLYEYTCQDS